MSEDDEVQGTSISQAHTLEEIADYWDARSLDHYWEQTHEAAFEVRAKRRRVAIDPDTYKASRGTGSKRVEGHDAIRLGT